MEQGWIKSYRKIMDNQFLMSDNTAYIVFTKLLHLVNQKTGTFVTGRFHLAERVNIKPTTLYKALIRLEDNRLVTLGSNNKFTVITICNWHKYQSASNSESDIKVTTGEQQSNNKVTLNKNIRIKNKELYIVSDVLKQLIHTLGFSDQVRVTDQRKRKLNVRLKTYTPDELTKAAIAISQNAYMQGDNDGGVRYGNIDYLLRSDEIVDKWLQRGSEIKTVEEMLKDVNF